MSSEESEGEVGALHRRYHVKELPWRAPELTSWLHQVDLLPMGRKAGVSSQERDRRYRILGEKRLISTTRQPPTGLPSSFYREEWLGSRPQWMQTSLEISKTDCPLPLLPVSRSRKSHLAE
jgi:hypothetical protein